MKRKSLKTKLLEYIRENGNWLSKGDVERFSQREGYLAHTGVCRLQELVKQGLVESKMENGLAWFRSKPKEIITRTIPVLGQTFTEKLF
jgi:hypothetical protein